LDAPPLAQDKSNCDITSKSSFLKMEYQRTRN